MSRCIIPTCQVPLREDDPWDGLCLAHHLEAHKARVIARVLQATERAS